MIVLGVDTALRCTGFGVVEGVGSSLRAIRCGLIKTPQARPHTECLMRLARGIRQLIEENRPDVCAIEGIFYCKNVRTAMALGQARGVVLAVCAEAGVPVFEHAPRRVKQAVVGSGSAHKEQVGSMVVRLLNLPSAPSEDETDALALAICHLHCARHPELSGLESL
ncbi:MAG TPA: crossover junction endodeoxyribonuclease RuvC [Kiritimatiellia bacterium]|nr:crossover junction endodeoxyribonuclease RuvC [Kiritimatiellia bacterium]